MSNKGESRKKHKSDLRDDKRRRERAAARGQAYRTPAEQLAHLDKHGLVAKKERAKLAKKLGAV